MNIANWAQVMIDSWQDIYGYGSRVVMSTPTIFLYEQIDQD
jgi:hypothetical protein